MRCGSRRSGGHACGCADSLRATDTRPEPRMHPSFKRGVGATPRSAPAQPEPTTDAVSGFSEWGVEQKDLGRHVGIRLLPDRNAGTLRPVSRSTASWKSPSISSWNRWRRLAMSPSFPFRVRSFSALARTSCITHDHDVVAVERDRVCRPTIQMLSLNPHERLCQRHVQVATPHAVPRFHGHGLPGALGQTSLHGGSRAQRTQRAGLARVYGVSLGSRAPRDRGAARASRIRPRRRHSGARPAAIAAASTNHSGCSSPRANCAPPHT